MSPTDAMLFENWLRERDADAFKTLAARYAKMVYETCRRVLNNASEAEDVTQECFIILANADKPVGGYLAPWLHRVAYNLGYAMLTNEDIEAFADAYRNRVAQGLPFDTDLDTSYGKFYRLREGVERFLTTNPNDPGTTAMLQSQIPILIEASHHHDPEGGNVLFMDGHVEFIRISASSKFPMNYPCMNILKSLSAMKNTTPSM